MIEAINYAGLEMPPTGKLSMKEINLLTRWVEMGAPWPSTIDAAETPTNRPSAVAGVPIRTKAGIDEADRSFWSFRPVRAVQVPEPTSITPSESKAEATTWSDWARTGIDRFILKGLMQNGLNPTSEADRRVLIRRVTYDLTGLPPTAQEIDEFLVDPRLDAYERLVDRLLASPRYGERWARHWLDLVRYAESDGHRQDAYRPDAWRYRDYVVRSFNSDKPYNQFLAEQLAGDEIDPNDPELRVATGYLRLTTYEYNQRNVRGQWADILNDITDVTGEVFLGLSLACARCHDHKFDPILQKDYYRLQAFFTPLLPRDDLGLDADNKRVEYRKALSRWEEATAKLRRELEEIEKPYRGTAAQAAVQKFPDDVKPIFEKPEALRTPLERQLYALGYLQIAYEYDHLIIKGPDKARWDAIRKELKKFDALKPKPLATVLAVTDVGPIAPPTVIPGDRKQESIAPGILSVLDPGPLPIEKSSASPNSTGRRLTLARWLGRSDNPLSTRVIVNRVWQYHFGRGIVPTSSDFGHLGEAASHPELLDHLVSEFVKNGWSVKSLHRSILTSSVYRQSALAASSASNELDPANKWLSHFPSRRLDAEEIRDSILAVSGELEQILGGSSLESTNPRRSVETMVVRNSPEPFLNAFDAPDGSVPTSQRIATTTPTQALMLLNGPWSLSRSHDLARRLERAEPNAENRSGRIALAYRVVLGREPEPDEVHAALEFLEKQQKLAGKSSGKSADVALTDFCHVLLNSNEFLFVD